MWHFIKSWYDMICAWQFWLQTVYILSVSPEETSSSTRARPSSCAVNWTLRVRSAVPWRPGTWTFSKLPQAPGSLSVLKGEIQPKTQFMLLLQCCTGEVLLTKSLIIITALDCTCASCFQLCNSTRYLLPVPLRGFISQKDGFRIPRRPPQRVLWPVWKKSSHSDQAVLFHRVR